MKFTKVGRVFPFFTDNPAIVHWDERIRKYVIYTRAFDYDSENQRQVGRIEVDDPLKPWPFTKTEKHRTFPSIKNIPVVYAADKKDDLHSDVYYNSASNYPWAQDVFLMFPTHFRHFSRERNPYLRPPRKDQWEDFGMLEVQLAVSRDGVKWQRPERVAYIPNGLADEWDRWYTVSAPGLVKRGNYVYQYYYSSGQLHDGAMLRPEYEKVAKQLGGVGVVKQRLDGYVSADADEQGGWLKTPPLTFRGNRYGSTSIPAPWVPLSSNCKIRMANPSPASRWQTAKRSVATSLIKASTGRARRMFHRWQGRPFAFISR